MCIRLYAVESMLYRIAGSLDAAIGGSDENTALLAALEEFAVEASIVKVAGSEMMDFVVDENVQIHGGNGFVRDYAAERYYRDARVNRIFEGTNEINRLLIPTTMARRLFGAGGLGAVSAGWTEDGMTTADAVSALRLAAHFLLMKAWERFGKSLGERQELLTYLADILIDTFAADSVMARAAASGNPLQRAAADVFVADAVVRAHAACRNALLDLPSAETILVQPLRTALDSCVVNTIELRREIAAAALSQRKYPFA